MRILIIIASSVVWNLSFEWFFFSIVNFFAGPLPKGQQVNGNSTEKYTIVCQKDGSRVHQCNLCNKTFVKLSHMTRHLERVTPCTPENTEMEQLAPEKIQPASPLVLQVRSLILSYLVYKLSKAKYTDFIRFFRDVTGVHLATLLIASWFFSFPWFSHIFVIDS